LHLDLFIWHVFQMCNNGINVKITRIGLAQSGQGLGVGDIGVLVVSIAVIAISLVSLLHPLTVNSTGYGQISRHQTQRRAKHEHDSWFDRSTLQ
jgi:hypothetical protein